MRLTSSLTIICLMQIVSNTNTTNSKYTVIAPGTIHCDKKYTAAIALHHTTKPCQVKVGINGLSYSMNQQIEVAPNEVKHVKFYFPCLEKGDHNLTVEGIDCLDNFKNTTKLIYNKFNNHVLIQTDKNLYAPGDDINFRVLFLDKDLRPAQPEKGAVIWFEDGKRNRIKKINDFMTNMGVYTGKFKISNLCATGSWLLRVTYGGEFDSMLHFEVNKYILPKFVVKVESNKSVSVKDGDIQVVVRANYNYGKPVDGKVIVLLNLEFDDNDPPILRKSAEMVKGIAKIDLNIKEYDAYLPYENSPSYVTVVATVEEKLTSVEINGTTSTTIYPYRYAINCINFDAYANVEVDKEKGIQLQITYINGSYLNDTKSTIELFYVEVLRSNRWWHHKPTVDNGNSVVVPLSQNQTTSFKGHMNETGFLNFEIALPDLPQYEGYFHYYSLQLKYLNERHEVCGMHLNQLKFPEIEKERQNEFFVLEYKHLFAEKLHLKKASQFTLNSSQPLSYFDYNVIGRGNILESGRIELPDKPKVYNLTLTPQFSWAPSFCVYVNYVDENGGYHHFEQSCEVFLELENHITVTAAKQVKPGEEVALNIKTVPNSFVGLMAVGHTAFLLRTDNDFNFYELKRVLGSYSTYTLPKGDYSTHPGEISGCVTLTNANYYYTTNSPKNIKRDLPLEVNKGTGTTKYSTIRRISDATKLEANKGFSQTWFFADIENTEAAEFTWTIKIPETINTWVLTAFSLNPQEGLGVTMEETKITTFLPFSISIRLPYSVKKGEVINVPAWLFNYLDKALDVEVTLRNFDGEYEFIEFDNQVLNEKKLSKNIRIPANWAAGVSFLLKPKVVGNVMLKFTINSQLAGDTIHKSMNVVAEGIMQYVNHAYFVNLRNESEFKSSFELLLPQNFVPDSEHVEVGVTGDILGPVLNNLDNLLRLPTGCGEQTMSTLLSNYLVIKYLKDTKRLTPSMEIKLHYNLETGYQNILNYRHTDGSFSSFTSTQSKNRPTEGSTWLTAYVVHSLQRIKEFINVDGKIIVEGLDYLSAQQATNGTFREKGDYLYASQSNHVSVTSSALLAIMENATYAEKYFYDLSKGLEFIAHNIGKSDSLHAQAIGTYTLNKAKHAAAKYEIYKLKALAKTESDLMWWSADEHRHDIFSKDVEITSYALLTLLDQQSTKIDYVLPIVNWLIAQRNSQGGFFATPDTVIGLTALIAFAKISVYQPVKMSIDIWTKEKNETINLTESNGILYQNIEMPPKTIFVNFNASGTGSALVQIAYQYRVFEKDPNPSFIIETVKPYNRNTPLHLIVCVTYVGEGDFSNMALLEISTPSGYVIDDDSSKEVRKWEKFSGTELKNADTLLVVYFDRLYKNKGTCLLVQATRTHAVAMQKPASIIIYDYYDTSKRATVFYEVVSKLCDICDTEEDCSKCITEASKFIWIKKIPATITSWVLTAFSSNPQKGLGITMEPTKVKTFQPFFISIRLPYSIQKGEVINAPAWVFNYLDKDLDVDVTLHNSDDEYKFIVFENKVISEQELSKITRVPANGAAGISFLLKPKVVGNVMLKFTAVSPVSGDAIHKSMKVVPEGITKYEYLLNLKNISEFNSSFELELDQDLIPGLKQIEVVIGDILGPLLKNLDTGYGEQTMSNLLPSYVIIKYLKDQADGSFSNFGYTQRKQWPPKGSTAYVVRYLQQIREFVSIDVKIIEEGLVYLSRKQVENGSFDEKGDNFHASKRNRVTVTCAAVLAIMENHATFTLNKAKYLSAKDEMLKLKFLVKTESYCMWWPENKQQIGDKWRPYVFSNDVETASFAFAQGTVVGLTALIEFVKFANYETPKMTVDVRSKESRETIKLTEDYGVLYQNIKVHPETKSIYITAKGTGSALIQIACQYNIFEKDPYSSFIIKATNNRNKRYPLGLQILVCVNYVGAGASSSKALMEISTPSGYVVDIESLKEIKESKRVRSTELKYCDTLLVV